MYYVEIYRSTLDTYRTEDIRDFEYMTKKEDHYFGSKEAAWKFFSQSISESYEHVDFFASLQDEKYSVATLHYDEQYTVFVRLWKWEDFDKDVDIHWTYNGKQYKTPSDMAADNPSFYPDIATEITHDGEIFVRGKGNEIAVLEITTHFGE